MSNLKMMKSESHHYLKVVALITKMQPQSDTDLAKFKEWLIELMMVSGDFPGFFSSEVIPPAHSSDLIWTLIQKFKTIEDANAWKQSDSLKRFMEGNDALENAKAIIIKEEISKDASSGMVATAVATQVLPPYVDQFKKLQLKIQQAQAKFPGYQGSYWQPPVLEKGTQFTALLRFDTPDALEHWLNSAERKQLVDELDKIVAHTKFSQLRSSFPGWFPENPQTGEEPAKWKTALLILVALYPMIMISIRSVEPFFPNANHALFNFLSAVCTISLITWVWLPLLIKLFTWWLFPKPESKVAQNWLGVLIMLAVGALEIGLFISPNRFW